MNTLRAQEICEFLIETKEKHTDLHAILAECKSVMLKQAQQIMQLMEQQLKYGINVVLPEDEITDFDIEKTLDLN